VMEYDMKDFLISCVDRFVELAGKSGANLRKVETPFIDETKSSTEQGSVGGVLQPIASKVLMKVLYAARMCRYDLLRATCALASKVTKWNSECDKQLHRLVCYIHSSLDVHLVGWIGDGVKAMELKLFSDADFAGDLETCRSTSGVFLHLEGPTTFFPLSGQSKKQSCVSHSTPEAEIVAADLAVRTEGLPALQLWEAVLERKVNLLFQEVNAAAIRIIETGKNPTIRHLGRTHRVDLAWLHEQFVSNSFKLM